jgi:hypothetical protein
MSEYQYYEFQAVDRPLTIQEQDKISDLSSRVQLTATSAVFTYSFGDFRGRPEAVLEKYFDAMLYLANWGTTQLMFRYPRGLLAVSDLSPYCDGELVSVHEKAEHLILNIRRDEDPKGWIEGEGTLCRLLPLRQQILERDYRLLYLAWLVSVEALVHNEAALEPPVPANLRSLSPELKEFVELFAINTDLLEIATETSPAGKEDDRDYATLISSLPAEERDQYLARLVRGEQHLAAQLRRRLRDFSGAANDTPPAERRTVGSLLSAATRRMEKREREKELAADKARLEHFERLARQEPQLWEQVRLLIDQKLPKTYDAAVLLLRDLHALASHRRSNEDFQARVAALQNEFRNRPGLLSRIRQAGF